MTVAQVFRASNMFPDIQSEAAACAKIIIGRGLGLTDYDAMTGLHIIKGKAVLAANLMAAAIKRAGKYDYRANCTDTECSIVFFGRNGTNEWEEIGESTFTLDDAKRAQLQGDNWRKYPKAMLFARCISAGYKQHCPDALGAAPVYVEAHGETEITDEAPAPTQARGHEAPKARAALAAAQPATIDAEAPEAEDEPEAAPAPAKPAEATPAPLACWPKKGTDALKAMRVIDRSAHNSAVLFEDCEGVKNWVQVGSQLLGNVKLGRVHDVDYEWVEGDHASKGYFRAVRVKPLG